TSSCDSVVLLFSTLSVFFVLLPLFPSSLFFSFIDTASTEIYTLSLHDALPIFGFDAREPAAYHVLAHSIIRRATRPVAIIPLVRSEEYTSELQSPDHLVCRLLLEKKKKKKQT